MAKGTKLTQTGQQVQGLLNRVDQAVLRNTTEHWNSSVGFVPFDGQIIVYSDYRTVDGKDVPGIKIGSGNGYVQDLAFLGEDDTRTLLEHITNETIHITADERFRWGRKLNVDDDDEVIGESLIFNRY